MIYENRGETRALFVETRPIATEQDIAIVERVSNSPSAIKIILTENGERKFNEGVKDMHGRQLAIIINTKIVSAPVLQGTAFGRELTINGNMTSEEADSLVSSFNKIRD